MMNEQISAWIDGELSQPEARRVHEAVTRQPAMQAHCGTLWLIGDVMRDEAPLAPDFTERVMALLESEPTVFAPVAVPARVPVEEPRRWMPWAAALAGVSVVAWVAVGNGGPQPAAPVMATAAPVSKPVSLASKPQRMDDDRPYLMAHQAYGPGVQMAGVSGYVRPVIFDEPIASR